MEDWQVISLLIVLLSFMLSAVAIMLSRLFQNKTLEQWAKMEMVFAFSTFLLVVFFIVLFEFGQALMVDGMEQVIAANYRQQGIIIDFDAMFPMRDPTVLGLSELYMDNVYSCLKDVSVKTFKTSAFFFVAESVTKDAFMGDTQTGWPLKTITQTAMNILNYSVFTAFLYLVFLHILKFISAMAFPLFFPVGIILRAFPPTRGAGAYVLAFVAGLYFIYPAAYLLVANMTLDPFYCSMPDPIEPPNMCNVASPGRAEAILLRADAEAKEALSKLEKYRNAIAGIFINLCCLPFLAMVITMSFILSSTNLLGANLPEVGRGFVKLI